MNNQQLSELESIIQASFIDKQIIINAFVHRSYLNENRNFELPSNERLEFLGDACLELIVSEYLFKTFPSEPEGILTSYRGALVNTDSLAESAQKLKLGKFLLLSHGEEEGGGRDSNYLLANTFEAVIGAIYLDLGFNQAERFVFQNIINKLDAIIKDGSFKDPKSKLQEKTQETYGVTPSYFVISEFGPDHNKEFEVSCQLRNTQIGTGKGSSKQKAELNAASNALNLWNTWSLKM